VKGDWKGVREEKKWRWEEGGNEEREREGRGGVKSVEGEGEGKRRDKGVTRGEEIRKEKSGR